MPVIAQVLGEAHAWIDQGDRPTAGRRRTRAPQRCGQRRDQHAFAPRPTHPDRHVQVDTPRRHALGSGPPPGHQTKRTVNTLYQFDTNPYTEASLGPGGGWSTIGTMAYEVGSERVRGMIYRR